MSQTVVLRVDMTCGGCVGAVKRVLGKLDGVESYDVDLDKKKVVVKGNVQPDTVLKTVSKTGKKTAFWEDEAPAEPTELTIEEMKVMKQALEEAKTKEPAETKTQ